MPERILAGRPLRRPSGLPRLRIRDPRAEQLLAGSGWPGLFVKAVRSDGSAIAFITGDSADADEGATALTNTFLAEPGPGRLEDQGPLGADAAATGTAFGLNNSTVGLSSDLTQSVLWINQPIAGSSSPSGTNLYLRRADGSIIPLTTTGAPNYSYGGELVAASQDFSRLFVAATIKQLETDPVAGGNTYEWFNGKLSLVTILPGETPAPAGGRLATTRAALPVVSTTAARLFTAEASPTSTCASRPADRQRLALSARGRRLQPQSAASPGGMSTDGRTGSSPATPSSPKTLTRAGPGASPWTKAPTSTPTTSKPTNSRT